MAKINVLRPGDQLNLVTHGFSGARRVVFVELHVTKRNVPILEFRMLGHGRLLILGADVSRLEWLRSSGTVELMDLQELVA